MALPTTQSQNELLVQRYANAMYDVQVGSTTMNQVLNDFDDLGNDAALNTYYNISHSGKSTSVVIDEMLGNLGLVVGENGLTAADVTAVRDAALDYLNAAAPGARGAAIADMLEIYADLEGGATVYAAAAAAWNAEVATALAYNGSADVVVGTIDPIDTDFFLTVGNDIINGSAADDTFTADVMQNANGFQVNSLATGDRLDGLAGNDVLEAQVTKGAFAGGGNMPIQPRTTDIEVVKLEAMNSSMDLGVLDLNLTNLFNEDGFVPNTDVYVDAKNMTGLDMISSWHSAADLTIMNLTTKADDGTIRNTDALTIGMGYTGNTDSHWDESDLHVYFDQDYLLAGQDTTSSQAYYYLLDQDAVDDGQPELDNIDRNGIRFSLDGVAYTIIPGTFAAGENALDANTWGEYRDALQAELDAMLASGQFDRLSSLTLTVDPTDFPLSDLDETFDDSGVLRDVDAIVVTDTAGGAFSNLGYNIPSDISGEFNVYGRFSTQPSAQIDQLITVNVELEKVGTGGDGGELVIGGMNKGGDNEWGDGSTTTPAGIEQFNVVVNGTSVLPNSLSSLRSTNNALQVVNVTSEAGVTADNAASLQIGNSNTDLSDYSNALKDVQTFDASAFLGDLTLYAGITDETIAKYLDLQDILIPSDDNVLFSYAGGVGDDDINLEVDVNAVEHEDFLLEIYGNAGNDDITLTLVNGATPPAAWYENNVLNDNLFIFAGAGDDIVMTPGSGNVNIELGAGNDAAYLDNTGDKAAFIFNAVTTDLTDHQSDINNRYQLYNTTLNVNFMGFAVGVTLPTTNGRATDLQINQAIKTAINNDAVLGKLLNAYDGNGNALVVESKIDGLMELTDLTISLTGPTALTLTDVGILNGYYGGTQTAAQLLTLIGGQVTAFNTNADYVTSFATDDGTTTTIVGDVSSHTSDNVVEGGIGNDVFVLGTGAFSNDTVLYEGYGNGNDTVVNFTTSTVTGAVENTAVVGAYTQGAAEETEILAEIFTVTVQAPAATGTVTYRTVDVALTDTMTAADVVDAFVAAGTFGPFTATAGTTAGTILFTETVPLGVNITNPLPADFVDNSATGAIASMVVDQNGGTAIVPAVTESFTVTFGDSTNATAYTFAGESITVAVDATAAEIATAVAAGTYTGWTAAAGAPGEVVFTSTATPVADVADVTAAAFVGANIAVAVVDSADFLDFSAYDVDAVLVNGAVLVGALAANSDYVSLVESTTNAGSYTVSELNAGADGVAGATDATLGLIGVVDFGATQAFVADNFII